MNDEIKVPGEAIGTEEEFVIKNGAYVENGIIYASCLGKFDSEKSSVKVKCLSPRAIKVGDVLLGRVEQMTDQVALIDLNVEKGMIKPPSYVGLHVSSIINGYLESIRDAVRIGDIVKVKVSEFKRNGSISVTMKEPGLGVVKAFCSRCRHPLPQTLTCEFCKSNEKRYLLR